MSKLRKVTFSVTIEVDADEWDLAYGCGTSTQEIRDDVRSSILNAVQQCDHGDGAIKTVTPRWS